MTTKPQKITKTIKKYLGKKKRWEQAEKPTKIQE